MSPEQIKNEKRLAGQHAAKLIENQMTIGLGTGTTVYYLVEALAQRVKSEHLQITTVATSSRTANQAKNLGITVKELDEVDHLDLTLMKLILIFKVLKEAVGLILLKNWWQKLVLKIFGLLMKLN